MSLETVDGIIQRNLNSCKSTIYYKLYPDIYKRNAPLFNNYAIRGEHKKRIAALDFNNLFMTTITPDSIAPLSHSIEDYPDGIVLAVDKPYRWTSADVIRKVKWLA